MSNATETRETTRGITPYRLYRFTAVAEAITWTLLILGLVLRATLDLDIAVSIGGGIHGFVFLTYAAVAVIVAINQRWSAGLTALAVGSAIVPYATIPLELWLARKGKLAGPWRLEASDDPRDSRLFDRALRGMLRHPVALVAVIVLGVIVLFTVLLILGPPGGAKS